MGSMPLPSHLHGQDIAETRECHEKNLWTTSPGEAQAPGRLALRYHATAFARIKSL
jgi:hypothetical protein